MRVLLVEDEHRLASIVKRGLEEEGYAVDLAYDGKEGFSMAQVGDYDLVVLDLMLPALDGLSIVRGLRQKRNNVPVLILTARDSVDDLVAGLDSGADDYITKPFAFRELLARSRALIRRDSMVRDPVIRIGDLEVDTVSHRVRRAGRPIELTSREYGVLEFLVRNPNHVLSRTQIAEHVWDYDFTAISNVVDVYIRHLRRKIDEEFEPKLIQTVRGSGYQLRSPVT